MARDKAPAKILLVDDHRIYREGIKELMSTWENFKIVGEAANGRQALEFCKTHAAYIDIILMNIQMPIMNGIEASRLIHERYPEIAIIILSTDAEDGHLVSAINAGVRGYILKDTSARQLKGAMESVMGGNAVLSDAVTERVFKEVRLGSRAQGAEEEKARLLEKISESEKKLLILVAKGRSNEEIALALYLSEAGVKKKLTAIMNKLSLANRVQLAVYATKAGLAN